MSSAPSSEVASTSDDYSYANNVDYYNMQFTADISKHMQMPDRLAAVDGLRRMNFHPDQSSELFTNESAAFAMTMPEKIVLGNSKYICCLLVFYYFANNIQQLFYKKIFFCSFHIDLQFSVGCC